ncbi:Enoyl-CoA hydratase/isomerase [Enhygromyxa salina]|uniref:Enoyl-CoA hydratase/isomerase n=1 Tax=Enhygromyxa salina TaxID=215803 RepID=A0A0C2D2L9_9BACT|nr:enoyl-CoA hydratase/isomerase family protein [Enhygromyxa salina]KIG14372.1 Enoyl-CoA hydratase/isomerase [Enhygromyxa salina]
MPTPPEGLREHELEPGVLSWVLDTPARRNAIHPSMFEWITARCIDLRGEVVILRGAGDRVFTSGFDLTALADPKLFQQPHPPDEALIRATTAIHTADATFVAALNGAVVGAGVELISVCDFRLACHGASLRLPAGKLGVVYHAAGLTRIHAAFGPTITRRLLLAGEKVEITDVRASLCALVQLDQLDAEARALAQRIRAQSARSVAGNRKLLRALDLTALPPDVLNAHAQTRREAYRHLAPSPAASRDE